MKKFYLKKLTKSRLLAGQLSELLKTGDVLTFEGKLGSGKTEFCRAIIHSLGYNEDVPSPTFNLVQTYEPGLDDPLIPPVWHMDLFRLESAEDVIELGVEVGFDTAITLIEWPDRMGNYLPLEHLKISLFQGDIEDSRYISFKGSSNWEQRIERLNV